MYKMEEKNINRSIEEAQRSASLQDAWERFMDYSETLDDLNLIMNSVRKGEDLHESHETLNRKWEEVFSHDAPFEPGELTKYKKKVRRMYAETKSRPGLSRNIRRFRKIGYAAAVLLLGLLIPAVYLYLNPKTGQSESTVQYVEVTTGRGEIKTFYLPDQTMVTLNVESNLKYPAVFAGERFVELKGEALFEVTPDSDKPFIVATTAMNISVLGTVFGVKAYHDDGLSMVCVASGKVEVKMAGDTIVLEKDRQLKINRETGSYEQLTVDANQYLSWTVGILYFHRTPVNEVVNMLNRTCPQLTFELAEGEYPNLITGKLDTKKLETMLDPIISSIGLKYSKTGNKIILY